MAAKHHNFPSKQRPDCVLAYMYKHRDSDTSLADLTKIFGYSRQTFSNDFRNLEERYWYNIEFVDCRGDGKGYRLLFRCDKEKEEDFHNYMKYFFRVHNLMF